MSQANAFDYLVRSATATVAKTAPQCSSPFPTKTAYLMHLLECNGPMSSVDLAAAACLSIRIVWGLLKVPLKSGRVERKNDLWSINIDRWDAERAAIENAISLLRSKGYVVIHPGEAHDEH